MMISSKQRVLLNKVVNDSYHIYFGENLFPDIVEDLSEDRKYIIITDTNVGKLHANRLDVLIRQGGRGITCGIFCFEAGEENKTIENCVKIADEMLRFKFGRDTTVIAVGGGVVGDLAGFVASMFNRGIPYIQVPTTVIAQADASVGGKTAVNTKHGKNHLGAFKQPEAVYIDVTTLNTLPSLHFRSGLAETVKHGVTRDRIFFGQLEEWAKKGLREIKDNYLTIARKNCAIKGKVVEKDPHEKGLRRVLNYGHTVGHAVEKLREYRLTHGEYVSIGMMVAGRIAVALKTGFTEEDLERQRRVLKKFRLRTSIPANISNEEIMRVTTTDKKAKNNEARYCLPSRIGRMCEFDGEWATHVRDYIVKYALNESR